MRRFAFIILILIFGCASVQPYEHDKVAISNLDVHIVTAMPDCDCLGLAVNRNDKYEIWIGSERDKNGNIIIDDYVLGHELRHIMNFKNEKVVNPDL
jgi:hypothetical protein